MNCNLVVRISLKLRLTLAPCLRSSSLYARPIPAAAPVIKATFPFNSITVLFYFERTAPECGNHYVQCGRASIATNSGWKGRQGEGSRVLPKFPFCSKYTHDRAPLSLAYVDSVSCGRFTGHFVVCTPTSTAIDRSVVRHSYVLWYECVDPCALNASPSALRVKWNAQLVRFTLFVNFSTFLYGTINFY